MVKANFHEGSLRLNRTECTIILGSISVPVFTISAGVADAPVSPNALRYDVRTIAFHWATVVLVAAQWVLAQVIDDF